MIEVFHSLDDVHGARRGAAIAIGNFDGVHKGHVAVIQAAAAAARARGVGLGVLTFEPHPRSVLGNDKTPFRLSDWRGKAQGLEALGVDFMAICQFSKAFAGQSADDFVTTALIDSLAASHVAVGEDFRFGKGRVGDTPFLVNAGIDNGFGVTSVPAMAGPDGIVFSSSTIRDALALGDVPRAADLLGRPWEIEGVVEHGDKRGRTIGFPTLNVMLQDLVRPALGVYTIKALIEGDTEWVGGVANIGKRPTVGGEDERLEAHLFDFDRDVYEKRVRVQLLRFIRPEKKFESFDVLKTQIAADADAARKDLL
ncbi:MAG: bifunctional riboflavin kinase/FAD synthetase [Alphaproteobacteria bacterium]|jgi:riboflavin kinase/FMN adenylyltransferase